MNKNIRFILIIRLIFRGSEYTLCEESEIIKEDHRFKTNDLILDLRSSPCILIKLRDTDPSN